MQFIRQQLVFSIVFIALSVGVHTVALAQEHTQPKVFNAESHTLENGLEIVVIPNAIAPVVTHMVWYRVGAADETFGHSGLAHFLEHLMFKGSEGLPPGEFSKTIKALGGRGNAFTSYDYTAYFQSVAKEHLDTVMKMEAGRMRGLNPPLEEVTSELMVVQEERAQRTDNSPRAKFLETLNAALYINHPYGRPIIGWMDEIKALDWESAKAFYDAHYAPNNAVLIVSGDVTPADVFALAQTHYGAIERRDLTPRTWPQLPPLSGVTKLTLHDEKIRQPSVTRFYIAPSTAQNKEHALALQVLEDIVGGGPTSRLYKSLVIDQKLATDVSLYYNSTSIGFGEIQISAALAPETSPETLESAIDAELEKLITDGVTQLEIYDTVRRLQADAIYARDSVTGPAMIIGRSLITGSTLDDIEYWPQDIERVTPEMVQNVAQLYLNPSNENTRFVTGYLLSEKIAEIETASEPAQADETPEEPAPESTEEEKQE